MNDGLKVSSDSSVGAITITDTNVLTSGSEGNIRYFGPNPNNYIYFNCSDYSNQTDSTCEKWRIIGIVDGKVKLIRNESIGDLAWDYDKNQDLSLTTYSNNWQTSSLQEFLNGLYYNRGTTETYTHYYYVWGESSSTLNMSTVGIKNDETREMISKTTWYLGGYETSEIYPNDIYKFERMYNDSTIYTGNPYTIDAKIGLMYASDCGYGANLKECSQNLNSQECTNWIFNSGRNWLITPNSSQSNIGWFVSDFGVYGWIDSEYGSVEYSDSVAPTLYLDSELTIESDGDGTSTNPYRIVAR